MLLTGERNGLRHSLILKQLLIPKRGAPSTTPRPTEVTPIVRMWPEWDSPQMEAKLSLLERLNL